METLAPTKTLAALIADYRARTGLTLEQMAALASMETGEPCSAVVISCWGRRGVAKGKAVRALAKLMKCSELEIEAAADASKAALRNP